MIALEKNRDNYQDDNPAPQYCQYIFFHLHSLHGALDLKNIAQMKVIFNSFNPVPLILKKHWGIGGMGRRAVKIGEKIKLNINLIDILTFLCYICKVTQKKNWIF